jgi:hypothetical protein
VKANQSERPTCGNAPIGRCLLPSRVRGLELETLEYAMSIDECGPSDRRAPGVTDWDEEAQPQRTYTIDSHRRSGWCRSVLLRSSTSSVEDCEKDLCISVARKITTFRRQKHGSAARCLKHTYVASTWGREVDFHRTFEDFRLAWHPLPTLSHKVIKPLECHLAPPFLGVLPPVNSRGSGGAIPQMGEASVLSGEAARSRSRMRSLRTSNRGLAAYSIRRVVTAATKTGMKTLSIMQAPI